MTQRAKPSRRLNPAFISTVAAASLVLSGILIPQLFASAAPTLAAGKSETVGCAGSSLTLKAQSKTSVTLACSATKAHRIGPVTYYRSKSTAKATTALPSGTKAGVLLISTLETPNTSVRFPSGWSKAYDAKSGSVRLITYWKVARPGEKAPVVVLGRTAQVTMVTAAFSGTASPRSIFSSAARAGHVSPFVQTTKNGIVLLTLGSAGTSANAPNGTTLGRSLNNGDRSHVAIATTTASLGGSSARSWNLARPATAVSGALDLSPVPPASVPTGATPVAAGGSWTSSCASTTVAVARISATTMKVSCAAASGPTSSPSHSSSPTPTASASTSHSASASSSPSVSKTPTATASPSVSHTTTASPSTSTSISSPPPVTVPGSAPTTPPAKICGSSMLNGPTSAPAGAVSVSPSQNIATVTINNPAGTTFWLAPGTYHLGGGQYDQIQPKNGDTYIGAPGAVIDGQHLNVYAFTTQATNVTLEYLTIQNFGAPGDNNDQGVVNHDSGSGWHMTYNLVQNNSGAGVFLGSNNVVRYNCLRNNGQYGFSVFLPTGPKNVTLDHNEISGNNTDDWESRRQGCGCTGGGKFWDVTGATVTNNWVHNNKGVGLWADTDDSGFLFQGNYIESNDDEGILYEISYNAAILNNTFVRNAIVKGPTNPGFPSSAIYISESGSDSRAPGPYGSSFQIQGNVFTDNWAGIIAWESADRFCGSPNNSSSSYCTLVNPSANLTTCNQSNIAKSPYFDDCRWKTQNLDVSGNTFSLDASHITGCTQNAGCGYNGLFSQYGTSPSWSPYQALVAEDHITSSQHNVWANNSYTGPWGFMIHEAGNKVSWSTWRGASYGQDAGSSLN